MTAMTDPPVTIASASTALATTDSELDPRFGLTLTKDERVLVAGKPNRKGLMGVMMVTSALVSVLTVFGLLLLPLIYFIVRAYVDKHRYWLTNSRVIVTTGIIGFRARSIPLERVSDVAISCSWLERAFGLRTVVVRDMTGEAMSGARMLAVENASDMQQQVLNRVHEVNRQAPSAEGERMSARSYREIENDHSNADMLELLRRIEANTRT